MSKKLMTRIDECSQEGCPHRKFGEWRGDRYFRQHCGLVDREFDLKRLRKHWFEIPEWCPLPEWSEA